MRRVPVESSMLRGVGYEAGTLEVEFKESGAVYRYFDVPERVHEELMATTDSHGTYFNAHIRDRFPYLRMQDPPA